MESLSDAAGKVLLKTDDSLVLYDVQQNKVRSEFTLASCNSPGIILINSNSLGIILMLQSIASISSPDAKYVCWKADFSALAIMSKHSEGGEHFQWGHSGAYCSGVILANSKMEHIATVHETTSVKSGCWDHVGGVLPVPLSFKTYLMLLFHYTFQSSPPSEWNVYLQHAVPHQIPPAERGPQCHSCYPGCGLSANRLARRR